MAGERWPRLRSALSSAVFLVVVLSSAAAGWALIERSEVPPEETVRDQVLASEVDPKAPPQASATEVAPLEGAIPVLAYNSIGEVDSADATDPVTFARQLAALEDAGFESVSLDDVAALLAGERPDLPDRPVVITVDGTHHSAWTTADPLLAAHGFDAVALVDPELLADHATSANLTWAELERLADSGRWTIGLGLHDVLTGVDDTTPDAIRADLTARIAALSAELGERLDRAPTVLSYLASGPGATEAVFQAGRTSDDLDLVFTAGGTEVVTRYWDASAVPRIAPQGLNGPELLRRIVAVLPPVPEGLDAPAAPDAPRVIVSLSWDDGRSSVLRSLAIQERHGVEATYFVNSDQIGTSRYYLSRGQLDEVAAGNEIGGHTEGHVNLPQESPAEARAAICDDRSTLVDWYGPAAGVSFAYPFGSNSEVEDLVAECGYRAGRITSGILGPLGCETCPAVESLPPRNRFAVAASGSVRADWTLADLQRLVLQAEEAGGGWVNYVLHALSSSPDDEYAVAPETYDALLSWLVERPNVTVATIGQVAELVDWVEAGAGWS